MACGSACRLVPYAVPFDMGKQQKQLQKMRNNPRDWRIETLKSIAEREGLTVTHSGTSHVTFRTSDGRKLTVPAHKPIKAIYVKMFVDLIDDLGGEL